MSHQKQPKPHQTSWRKRLAIGVPLAVVTLMLLGILYQTIATAVDMRRLPPPGKLVDVGGYALHIDCVGSGSPTILVDNGAGNWSVTWAAIQARIANDAQICLYDRAGLGWSDSGPMPRTSEQMVAELHSLLRNAKLEPPYIMVGHSLGGYNARIFQNRYPELVAGVVLVESGHESQWTALPDEISAFIDEQTAPFRIAPLLAHFGLLRFISLPTHESLSSTQRDALVASMVQAKTVTAILAEFDSAPISADQLAKTGDLGNLPLAVVTARNSFDASRAMETKLDVPFDEADRIWFELQEELVSLSTNSQHFVSEIGSHDINFDDPELVVEGILHVFRQVRKP